MDRDFNSWHKSLENILNESRTEQACYDFKIGLYHLHSSNSFNQDCLNNCIKTLTAMTNLKVGKCYIIIGVADKQTDADKHEKLYGTPSVTYNGFNIVGINGESDKNHKRLDDYNKKILNLIDNQPISQEFKNEIKKNFFTFNYQEKEILILSASRLDKPQSYNNEFYIREFANTKKVDSSEIFDFMTNFDKESKNEYKP